MKQTKEWTGKKSDGEFAKEYNQICGVILQKERARRQISQERLASGILSRTALAGMEAGKIGWTKVTGDILMHRMGIEADFFEVVASAEELDRWRWREDLCLMAWREPARAMKRLEEYRQKYVKREPVEEQFLRKMEAFLMILERKRTAGREFFLRENQILKIAQGAVACTLSEGWERGLNGFLAAPAELDAVLVAAAALAVCGRNEEAWDLQQAVWKYPGRHQWGERMAVLIIPQAALLGMDLALQEKDMETAFSFGKDALELVRSCCSQRYVLPLLERMKDVSVWGQGEREYLEKVVKFCAVFQQVYENCHGQGYRLWQSISVDNTRDTGVVLKMLRLFEGKSRARAVYDGIEHILSERQLEKIEKGIHKPSYTNYQRLMKQYGKYGGWKTAMLETDLAEVLELRQSISTLIGFGKWEEAERELRRFYKKVDSEYPKVKQEILRFEALIRWKKGDSLEKCLEILLEAFYCTVPSMEGRKMQCWVFQREEIMIASNIATIYRRLGRMDEAKVWFEEVYLSLQNQQKRTGIMYKGYDILMDGYDNLLGDIGAFEDAVKIDEEAIHNYLNWPQIRCMPSMFYRIAWNSYEIAARNTSDYDALHSKWQKSFQICEVLTEFIYDSRFQAVLKSKREKFLV